MEIKKFVKKLQINFQKQSDRELEIFLTKDKKNCKNWVVQNSKINPKKNVEFIFFVPTRESKSILRRRGAYRV